MLSKRGSARKMPPIGKGRKATKEDVCHNCGKPGHFKRDCWSAPRPSSDPNPKAKGKPPKKGKGGKGRGKAAEVSAGENSKGEPEEEEEGDDLEDGGNDIGYLSMLTDAQVAFLSQALEQSDNPAEADLLEECLRTRALPDETLASRELLMG